MEKQYQLPKEFAEKWVKALRSGEYKQGKGWLYNESNDCHCSMGVGLSINGFAIDNKGMVIGGRDPIMECMSKDYNQPSLWYQIYNMNDNLSLSFHEIADWIEANVEFI